MTKDLFFLLSSSIVLVHQSDAFTAVTSVNNGKSGERSEPRGERPQTEV